MASNRSILGMVGIVGGVVAAGYGVATYGSSKSVGLKIPEQKAILRTQGAQGEARKSGLSEKEATKIESVPTSGGDKGFKVLEKDG
jgi:hypothetical protein